MAIGVVRLSQIEGARFKDEKGMTKDMRGQEISLAVDYAENPVIRAMLRLIPGGVGSAADVLIVHRADQIKKERIRTFFDALGNGQVALTPELINSNDFIHSLDATLRAALRSRRAEKIQLFARLLERGMIGNEAQSVDDYEELVGVLDELSYREWQALMLFEHHLANSPSDPNPLARVQPFWKTFVAELEDQLGVHQVEASSFMIRIARTGLYSEITGAYWDYTGGLGITTPKLERLIAIVNPRPATAA
jgi:hypothetical protein